MAILRVKTSNNMVIESNAIKRYPFYKDSEAKWLGDIPSHWDTLTNKNIFKLKKNQVGKKSEDYILLSLTLNGVIKRDIENPQGKFPAEFNTYQEVKKGDFIFCLFDVEETPRCVGLSDFDGMITGAYTVMEPNDNFDRNFLYYFYLNLDADKRLKPLYTGLRNTISKENFFSFKSFVPPLLEQTAIAEFLDRKTTLIDQAIGIKQKQIELLKERRQILIHKAVTRGLNPNVKMKNSGVEWIGEIPEHWKVLSNKNIFKLKKNQVGKKSGDYVLLSLTLNGVIKRDMENPQGKFPAEFNTYQEVKKGDFIFCLFDVEETPRCVGLSDFDGMITGAYTVMESTEIFDKKFLYYYFIDIDERKRLKYLYTGLRNTITKVNFFSLKIVMPSFQEQKEISCAIRNTEDKIFTAISLKEQEIEKLKEYKATLINSVVTGKIKVYNDAK